MRGMSQWGESPLGSRPPQLNSYLIKSHKILIFVQDGVFKGVIKNKPQ